MTTLYIFSGTPGSGKTTLAHELAQQYKATVHSYDTVPGANTKASMDGSVKQAWLQAIRADLEAGKSAICDAINLTVKKRRELLSAFADIPCEKVLIVKVVPLEVCLERNAGRKARLPDFVITQAAEKFEAPSEDEAWDKIYISKD